MQPAPSGVTRRTSLGLVSAVLALGVAMGAAAQSYPSRNVTIIVPFPAGGIVDAAARLLQPELERALGRPVVIENRGGAAGAVGTAAVVKAEPDGHTLLFVTDAMTTIEPQLAGPKKLDLGKEFVPIVNMAYGPLALAAATNVAANSLAELVQLGKKDPEYLSFGTSGNTTPHRIAGELLQQRGGFKMTHVAYKGTAASVTDLTGGHIELVVGAAGTLKPLADAGKVKLLAVMSKERMPFLPDVPTVAETFPGFEMVTFLGLMAPKGTPAEAVAVLNREVNKILAVPAEREALEKQGMIVAGGAPGDFTARIAADYGTRGKVIRELGLTADPS